MFPFRLTGIPFFGIGDLLGYENGMPAKSIQIEKGTVQLVLVVDLEFLSANSNYINNLCAAVSGKVSVKLHLISIQGRNPFFSNILLSATPNVHCYTADITVNTEVSLIVRSVEDRTLLISESGQLMEIDKIRSIEQI